MTSGYLKLEKKPTQPRPVLEAAKKLQLRVLQKLIALSDVATHNFKLVANCPAVKLSLER